MSKSNNAENQKRLEAAQQRAAALRESIGEFQSVCSGTLARRMLPCGSSRCRCSQDKAFRHGPYFYWGRRKAGRLVQKLLTPHEAEFVGEAIRNYKAILGILRRWEDETVKIIEVRRTLRH